MSKIVECIANYSEARRPAVVEAIAAAIQSLLAVRLLDRHSDLDHNRTVLTFIGPPAEVEEAAFRSIAKAAELINLDEHQGEHPRLGASDVVPFVPIEGVTMQDCVEMARRVGRRVGEELGIPVYLYEQAATRPERQNLENIRRGQYEALKTEMGVNPARDPDFGPKRVGTAGATVIGARHPLIAFNVYLTTEDVSIARKIAKAVRQSSGGFRYVKGNGFLVSGRAQVSMNLTNYRGTPVATVVEFIRREAARYGVGVHHSELVGLIPQEALVDAAVWYLQLDQFERGQILESKLYGTTADGRQPTDSTLNVEPFDRLRASRSTFLDELAAATPTPGGGSAAAYAGAMAAGLAAMVARLTVGKKKYADVEPQMWALIERAEALRAELAAGVDKDAVAFEAVMAAFRLPKDTPEEQTARDAAIQQATLEATLSPLETARKSVETLELIAQAAGLGNVNAISDAATAGALARAALAGAGYNVHINIASLRDKTIAENLINDLSALEGRASALEAEIRQHIQQRGGLG